jgi:hypothetical protein
VNAKNNPTYTADGVKNTKRQTSALVDYHERTPQIPPPQPPPRNPLAARRTGPNPPEPRMPYGDSDPGRAAPLVGSGQFRPHYSERDYANHSHWDDQQRGREWDTAGADQTGSWRVGEGQANQSALALPPLDGFDSDRDYPAVLWWTAIWYAAWILLYMLMALIFSTSTVRSHAMHALIGDAPAALFAIAISLGVAIGARRVTLAWRAITVGFGAAVIGGGIATLLISVL